MSPAPLPYSFFIFMGFFAISSWAMAIQQSNDATKIGMTSKGLASYQIQCNESFMNYPFIFEEKTMETDVQLTAVILPREDNVRLAWNCNNMPESSIAMHAEYAYLNVTCETGTKLTLVHLECQDCSPKRTYCPHPPPTKEMSDEVEQYYFLKMN